jgi:opacity protein-like surface antigen
MKSMVTLAALLIGLATAFAADVPDDDEIKAMSDKTLLDWNKAIHNEDFSAFLKNDCASVWQQQTSPDKLRDQFNSFIEQKLDIAGAVKEMEPVFKPKPSIGKTGDFDVLTVKGYYDTKPSRLSFQLKYIEEEDEWKLVGIDLKAAKPEE